MGLGGIDALVLDTPSGLSVDLFESPYCGSEMTEGLDVPPVQLALAARLGAAGAARVGQRVTEREITLPFDLHDPGGDIAAEWDEVVAAIFEGGTLTITVAGRTRVLRDVEYRGGMEGVWSFRLGLPGGERRSVAAEMVALDPWWYGEGDVAVLSTSAATAFDDASTAFDDAVLFDGAAATPITVSGNAAASPITTITGPFDTLTVGLAGGQAFQLADALASGNTITVDTRPGNRGPRLNGGAVDWSLLTEASRLFELPVGTSTLLAQASGTDGNSLVSVGWDERWLTP